MRSDDARIAAANSEHAEKESGPRESARLRHSDGARLPFVHRLWQFAARIRAALRRPPIWLAGEPDHRQRAVARLRPVLCISVLLSDASDVLAVGAVRLAEPRRQAPARLPVWPAFPSRRAMGPQ